MIGRRIDRAEWREYLSDYHARFPGITEDVLGAAQSGDVNPYQWLLEVVPPEASLLDLACGSAPLLSAGWSGPWVGLDRSQAELDVASRHGNHHFITGDAGDMPFDDAFFGAIACSMALMLLDPLRNCLKEASRVLIPGGTMAVLLPGGAGPLTPGDLLRWTRLLVRFRRVHLAYPNDREIQHLKQTLNGTDLVIVRDERRRFASPLSSTLVAQRFVDSLYVPRVPAARIDAARRLAATWVGSSIGIPLRRIVVRKNSDQPWDGSGETGAPSPVGGR